MEGKMEQRELKKINNKEYLLVIDDEENKLRTEKGYAKDELKEIFLSMKVQRSNLIARRNILEKQIGKLDVEETPALKEFKEKLITAQKLAEKDKLEGELKMVKADIKQNNEQLLEISKSVPEITRGKK